MELLVSREIIYLRDKEGPSTIVFLSNVDLNSGGREPAKKTRTIITLSSAAINML